MPYERDIYVTMLTNWIKEENERIQKRNHQVKMANELTEQEREQAANLLREESKDLATSIGLMKKRNKAMESVIDVEKDIKKDLSLIHISEPRDQA